MNEYDYNNDYDDDDYSEDEHDSICDICGGQFWDGGSSCFCDYKEPIGKVNPICFIIGHTKLSTKERCARCQMSPWHDSHYYLSIPFRKSFNFTLPAIVSGWWYSFKWKFITYPLQKYRIYQACSGCNKPMILFGKEVTRHDHSDCLPF